MQLRNRLYSPRLVKMSKTKFAVYLTSITFVGHDDQTRAAHEGQRQPLPGPNHLISRRRSRCGVGSSSSLSRSNGGRANCTRRQRLSSSEQLEAGAPKSITRSLAPDPPIGTNGVRVRS